MKLCAGPNRVYVWDADKEDYQYNARLAKAMLLGKSLLYVLLH